MGMKSLIMDLQIKATSVDQFLTQTELKHGN